MQAETAEMGNAPSEGEPPSDTPRAPRHGLNAKALLMQAAALAAEEAANIEETVPETLSLQKQQVAELKSAFTCSSKLLTGIPKRETPVVTFVNHTKIPRVTRQQVLQKLAGQHLAMALIDANQELTPDSVTACEDLRRAALSAAIDQELKLFKSCFSKVSYSNAAARTDASLIKFPPATLTPQATSGNDPAQQTGAPTAPGPDTGSTKKRKNLATGGASEISEMSHNKQSKVEEASTAAAVPSTALLDDDIDWTATADKPDLQLTASPDPAVLQAGDPQPGPQEPDTALEQSQCTDSADGSGSACLQPQQAAAAAHEVPSSSGGTGDKQVQLAVGEYVKALLDPFYKAGIVDREMYKLVIKKTVNKIVHIHIHAKDADFLLHESEQIQKLLREYIRYAQKKCHR